MRVSRLRLLGGLTQLAADVLANVVDTDRLVDYCMNTPQDGYRTALSVETIKKLVAKNKATLGK